MSAPPFLGQPGDPYDDPQVDQTAKALADAFKALSLGALVVGTDAEPRLPRYLADADVIAFGFPPRSREARLISEAASVVRELAVSA